MIQNHKIIKLVTYNKTVVCFLLPMYSTVSDRRDKILAYWVPESKSLLLLYSFKLFTTSTSGKSSFCVEQKLISNSLRLFIS